MTTRQCTSDASEHECPCCFTAHVTQIQLDSAIQMREAAEAKQNKIEQQKRTAQNKVRVLERRQTELHTLIVDLSKNAIMTDEAEELRGQIASLIARVGTLEAERTIGLAAD